MKRLPRGLFELGSPVRPDGLINTGASVMVDIDKLVRNRLLVNANSGAGKSWAVRRILEHTYGGLPQLILDPEGEFHTLREKFDYVLAGRPGGQKGDCPAEPKSAALLARRLLELGVSAVIDLFELDPADRILFAKRFLDALLDAPRALWRPTLVVVDEAHVFCPEKGEGEAQSRDAVIALMSKGRKRGYGGVLATQRLAKLHKSAAAEANNMLIGRTALDVDLDRAGKVLGYDRARRDVLKKLPPGRFHAFGPAISDEVIVVHVGPVMTHHPEAGDGQAPLAPPRAEVQKILGQLATLPEEAAAELKTMDELRQKVKELDRQLKVATTALEKAAREVPSNRTSMAPGPKEIERALTAGRVEGYDRGYHDGYVKAKEHADDHVAKALTPYRKALGDLEAVANVLAKGDGRIPRPPTKVAMSTSPAATSSVPRSERDALVQPHARHRNGTPGPEQKLLNALAWFEAIGVEAPGMSGLAFLAGYSPDSSTFANIRGSCRTNGWVEYPGSGTTKLTEAGRAIADVADVPQSNEGLQQAILAKLDGPARKLLAELIPHGSEGLSAEQLAERTGYSASSSTFANIRGRLRSLGLVDYPSSGRVRATMLLYPED